MLLLKVLLKFYYYLSITPKYDFKMQHAYTSNCHKLYSAFLAILTITLFFISSFLNPLHKTKYIFGKMSYIRWCLTISCTVQLIVMTLNPLVNLPSWNKMMKSLHSADSLLKIEHKKNLRRIITIVVVLNLIKLTHVSLVLVMWSLTTGFSKTKYYISISVSDYLSFCFTVLTVHINRIISSRFDAVKNTLQKSFEYDVKHGFISCLTTTDFTRKTKLVKSLQRAKKAHQALSDAVKQFNKIFGYQITFQLAYLLFALLERLCDSTNQKIPKYQKNYPNMIAIQSATSLGFKIVSRIYNYVLYTLILLRNFSCKCKCTFYAKLKY